MKNIVRKGDTLIGIALDAGADYRDIAAMNEVWDAWVVPGTAPPRATVQAALADPSWKIEIVVTAAQTTQH